MVSIAEAGHADAVDLYLMTEVEEHPPPPPPKCPSWTAARQALHPRSERVDPGNEGSFFGRAGLRIEG